MECPEFWPQNQFVFAFLSPLWMGSQSCLRQMQGEFSAFEDKGNP
jgi:hypothetical protein